MTALEIVLGIVLLVAALFLIVAVLMQNGKSKRLSGTIAGGADTFFGKTKGKTASKILSKLTTAVAVLFVVIVLVVYLAQAKEYRLGQSVNDYLPGHVHTETTDAVTTEDVPTTEEAPVSTAPAE